MERLDCFHLLSETVRETYFRIPSQSFSLFSDKQDNTVFADPATDLPKDAYLKKAIFAAALFEQLKTTHNIQTYKEVLYVLNEVFDPSSYKNSKKRHKTLVYPFKWMISNNFYIKELKEIDIESVTKLHEEWKAELFKNEKMFRILFPSARYMRCFKYSVGIERTKLTYLPLGIFQRDSKELCAVRVVGIEGSNAFDLAFFGKHAPSQFMNYAEVVTLARIKDMYPNVEYFNCGAGLVGGKG